MFLSRRSPLTPGGLHIFFQIKDYSKNLSKQKRKASLVWCRLVIDMDHGYNVDISKFPPPGKFLCPIILAPVNLFSFSKYRKAFFFETRTCCPAPRILPMTPRRHDGVALLLQGWWAVSLTISTRDYIKALPPLYLHRTLSPPLRKHPLCASTGAEGCHMSHFSPFSPHFSRRRKHRGVLSPSHSA